MVAYIVFEHQKNLIMIVLYPTRKQSEPAHLLQGNVVR